MEFGRFYSCCDSILLRGYLSIDGGGGGGLRCGGRSTLSISSRFNIMGRVRRLNEDCAKGGVSACGVLGG